MLSLKAFTLLRSQSFKRSMSDTRICGRLGAIVVVIVTLMSWVLYIGYYPPMEVLFAYRYGSSIRIEVNTLYV